ncbi:histidine phosphatase family protein [Candidatus Woesearchaeota archaeon]|nr:histidine phosphatase family protein [Candidatus Woesearchaeota archaeon]
MRLTIVRHGETVENREDICQGQKFGTLSERGKEQAKKLALRLKNEKFDIIYCSDLKRTKDTLTELLEFHPHTKVVFSPELREQSKGTLEGKHHDNLRKLYRESEIEFKKIKAPGGESYEELEKRAFRFYDQTVAKHAGQKVLWVTHGGIIVAILGKVLKLDDEGVKSILPENTAVSVIEVDDNGNHHARIINCTNHL